MNKKYTIGIDFGTLSARAVALDLTTGEEAAVAVFAYPHGVMDRTLPSGKVLPPQYALQHPQDYLDALREVIGGILQKIEPTAIKAICLDFTTCTVLPVDEKGIPLCFDPCFRDEPHAYVKLWKHHGAVKQAKEFDRVANSRGEKWMVNCGGTSSSEWLFPKFLEILQEAPEVYRKTHRFYEAADWLSLVLTGQETHNPCMAGLKAYWDAETGFPGNDFFCQVDPRLDGVVGTKICGQVASVDQLAGYISKAGAVLTGLPEGTPVAMPIGDAHAALPALNVCRDGDALLVIGTSGVMLVNTGKKADVPGIFSLVDGGVFPNLCTMESGQTGLGDCFDWFVKNCVPGYYQEEARKNGKSIHTLLQEKVAGQRPGESRLIALDWFNGNRSILKKEDLSGLILGMTLQTRTEEIYRALMESAAYGLRVIVDNYEAHGVPIRRLYAAGGIAIKSSLLMQIYADVLGKPIVVSDSSQAGARGSALYAAVAAGECGDIIEAAAKYAQPNGRVYQPNPKNVALYDALYREYRRLHDYFGTGGNNVMDRLYDIYYAGQELSLDTQSQ